MKVKVWRQNNSWFLSFSVIQGLSARAAVTVFWCFQLLLNFNHLILLAYHLRNLILMKFLFFGSSIRLLEAKICTRSGWLKTSSSSSEVFCVCYIVGCADVRRRTVQTFGRQPEITWVMSKTRTPIRLARLASKTHCKSHQNLKPSSKYTYFPTKPIWFWFGWTEPIWFLFGSTELIWFRFGKWWILKSGCKSHQNLKS